MFVWKTINQFLSYFCLADYLQENFDSLQVIRVKWSLHAREEIVFELLKHFRGNAARSVLEGIRKSTREMIQEQEAVRGRLFTIQDVMQSNIRAWLQVKYASLDQNRSHSHIKNLFLLLVWPD